jgi:hypothetical protein
MENEVFLTPEEYAYLFELARDAEMSVEEYLEAMAPDIFQQWSPPLSASAAAGTNHHLSENRASLIQRIWGWLRQ